MCSLTCRRRRIKCDERKPICAQCVKSDKTCEYASSAPVQGSSSASFSFPATGTSTTGQADSQFLTSSPELRLDLSPLTFATSLPSPNSAPFEWYDLLAEDAINNIQRHNLGFDGTCLPRRRSPVPETPRLHPGLTDIHLEVPGPDPAARPSAIAPWNTPEVIPLNDDELGLLQHYVSVVGPILDLFDPCRHFATVIPRLAIRNVGLLKSLLAVAARHIALHSNDKPPHLAMQYYYETLQYLGQNLLYVSYSRSTEIIATTILISTYEMFDSEGSYSNGAWERHLRGVFWIQRSQDNNGESRDGIRRAVWWAWVRQDIWVAFREGRRTLTIWRPTKRLMDLVPDELATRIIYISARCVDFAANEKNYDLNIRIEQGDRLLQALEDWYRILPPSFRPIYAPPPPCSGLFSPIWIHPPSYAAAMQTFHFARITVLISQPSIGGTNAFRQRQRLLDESVIFICGIAMTYQAKDLPSAFVNFQALYAGVYIAAYSNSLPFFEQYTDVCSWPLRSDPCNADGRLATSRENLGHHPLSAQVVARESHGLLEK